MNVNIQALAKQAGIFTPSGHCATADLAAAERFADLYREALIAGSGEPESFEKWNAKQHGDPEEIGFLQALRIAYIVGLRHSQRRASMKRAAILFAVFTLTCIVVAFGGWVSGVDFTQRGHELFNVFFAAFSSGAIVAAFVNICLD